MRHFFLSLMPNNYKFVPGRLYRAHNRMQASLSYFFWEVGSVRNSFNPTFRNEPVIVMHVRDPRLGDFIPALAFPPTDEVMESLCVVFFEQRLWLAPKKELYEYEPT